MEIKSKNELERENLTLRHKYKMLKIKYNMINKALKRMTLLFTQPTNDFINVKNTLRIENTKGEKHGHN